jgi:hypothetical protein
MRLYRLSLAAGALLALVFSAGCNQRPADPALPTIDIAWRTIHKETREFNPRSVWASGLDDIYVGWPAFEQDGDVVWLGSSRIRHFDGATWQDVPVPISDERGATSIWGSAPDDVYVAVERLYHFDGSAWTAEPFDARLVTGTSRDNVYAADYGSIFHFDGMDWDTLATPDPESSVQVFSATPDGRLFVRSWNTLYVFDGAAWAPLPWVDPYAPSELVAFSATDAVALRLETGYPNYSTGIYRWNGTSWQLELTLPGDFISLGGSTPTSTLAVGPDGLVARFDGAAWTILPRPTAATLSEATGAGPTGIVAVGEGGKVVAHDGSAWRVLREGTLGGVYGIWAESPSRILALGQSTVYELDGNRWFENVMPTNTAGHVAALGGTSLDNVYASLFGGRVLHYDGQQWTVSADSLAGTQYAFWTSPTGTIVSAGDRSAYRFDGSWQQIFDGSVQLNALSGASDGMVVGLGRRFTTSSYVVMRYDGASWREFSTPAGHLEAVYVDPSGDIYLAGDGLFRWDGQQFRRLTPPRTGEFHGLFGTHDGRVIALSSEQTAIFDGTLVNLLPIGAPYIVTQARDGTLVGSTFGPLVAWKP